MSRYLLLPLLAISFSVGCTSSTSTETTEAASYGQFVGDVVASWNNDGREMTLRENFTYVDAKGRQWVAPAGAVVNGASIPSAFWTLIGGPFEGQYRNASVVHDVGCEQMTQSWEDVHRMFYEACRCGGVPEGKAKTLYYAVYHFGPRWQPIVETVAVEREDQNGRVVMEEVQVQRMVRVDPLPPTPEELVQVHEYVTEENPALEEICKCTRAGLCNRHKHDHDHSEGSANPTDGTQHPGNPASNEQARAENSVPHQRGKYGRPNSRMVPSRDIPPDEQQWVVEKVRQYVDGQSTEPRPAQYSAQRMRGGAYRVTVQFLLTDEQGQLVTYEGGITDFRVSREGQIMEVVSGPEVAREVPPAASIQR